MSRRLTATAAPGRVRAVFAWLVASLLLLCFAGSAAAQTAHAIVGATVVVGPGEVIDDGTVVVRHDRIVAVGERTATDVPPDARVWPGDGLRVYAGFFEPWLEHPLPEDLLAGGDDEDPGRSGPSSWSRALHPELRVVDGLVLDGSTREKLLEAGFTLAALVPEQGILRGRAAVVHLGESTPRGRVLVDDAGVAVTLRGLGWGAGTYPGSHMGAVAALRQSLLDAQHARDDRAHYESRPDRRPRPVYDPASEALIPIVDGQAPLLVDSRGVVMMHRAATIAADFDLRVVHLGTGGEWRRPDLVPDGASLILPLDFPDAPKVDDPADWIDVSLDALRHWEWAPENPAAMDARGARLAFTTHGLDAPSDLWKALRTAGERGLDEATAIAALTERPAAFYGLGERVGRVESGRLANLTVLRGDGLFDEDVAVAMVVVDGVPHAIDLDTDADADTDAEEAAEDEAEATDDEPFTRVARVPLEDRGPFLAPEVVVVRDATVWTSADDGVLEEADLLVRDGRIVAVGRDLDAPDDAHVIDARGKHVTAGLIDTHSHIAVVGSVNEGTNSTTAEVRIADVLNSEDGRIYEQLAGGLTSSHVMHGSANAIGGQCQAIKLRWGGTPDDLVLEGARKTIKFALGENPKRSNWNPPPGVERRYPRTRMGVEDVIRERFAAAVDYVRTREQWDSDRGPYPRVDLQLEALAEILADERDIHCHSYRQDEILALMRLMEEFDGRVAVFQHVLEGYKVADEMAEHGAAGSTFADWWAYKFEVYDAIPHGTTIMDDRGVLTTVNSDSPDLARRMNTEVAKSVRYGGTSEERSLNMVTINAAAQLGADDRIGSLEAGKDADFVVWSHHPLATRAVAEQTWIDGALYWDHDRERARREAVDAEREALIARADEAHGSGETGEDPEKPADLVDPEADPGAGYRPPEELHWAAKDQACSAEHVHHGGAHE